ncbi:tyrosinase family protein [Caballeronia sp. LP006]|uniref:tyrosinase family protein n=1 Tax=Caballeronia sp. LP006 TaxID=3038552 RepID=UPI002856FC6D|nr:tyrosinase family protein [Caballeronia sp. LP006]MDR5826715.1 tyrosinase family protein [Caballeronia sp. LP006]
MASTITRRSFVTGTASALALASIPELGFAATPNVIRLEWQVFKTTPHYASFLNAIRTMRATADSSKPASWQYWSNVHSNYCPHGVAYFLTWHRGYIYYFEQQLRTVSGDNTLTLPYWDYYTYPVMPSEFTDTASGNPLYTSRVNTNVYQALDLSPFARSVANFQRGTSNAFETKLENAPHNPVHDIIGGYMADIMTAPLDPIFYLHHANLDRLWNAWSLRSTSKVPAANNKYWSGSFTYATNLTMTKAKTRTTTGLGYDYANDAVPVILPPQAERGGIIRVQAQMSPISGRPQIGTFTASAGRTVSSTRRSLGGVKGVALADNSISARIPLQAANATLLRDTLAVAPEADDSSAIESQAQSQSQAARPAASGFRHVNLVLDGVSMPAAARAGGFFYNVYVNLPATGDPDAQRDAHFVGTLGAFEVSTATHHGGSSIEFPVTELLARAGVTNPNEVVVSFVRVSGVNAVKGTAISIGEMRVELAADAP